VYSIPLHRGFRGRDKSTISTHTEKENSFLFLGFITKIYVDIAQSVLYKYKSVQTVHEMSCAHGTLGSNSKYCIIFFKKSANKLKPRRLPT
jgi:hypothetical protein